MGKNNRAFMCGTYHYISHFLSVFMSVAQHISGTIYRVIIIFGTHLQNDNISKYIISFFNLDYLSLKGKKMAQNELKKKIFRCHISGIV